MQVSTFREKLDCSRSRRLLGGGMREATVTHRLSNPGALFQLVEAKYQNDVLLADLRSSFNLCGYVALPHLFCPESFDLLREEVQNLDRKSTRLNSSHVSISYAVFCLKKKKEV